MKTANPEDVLKSVHTQLMKRMALPLTVRLGLNCETPNPEEILAQVPASPDDSTGVRGCPVSGRPSWLSQIDSGQYNHRVDLRRWKNCF